MGLKKYVSTADAVVTEAPEEVENKEVASSERLQKAIDLMCQQFKIGEDYILTAFADKGNSVKITMSSPDFEVACTIKKPYEYGFEIPVV